MVTINITQLLLETQQGQRMLSDDAAAAPVTAATVSVMAASASAGADLAFMLIAGVLVFLM